MHNQESKSATAAKSNEGLVVAFQDFNGVFIARITSKDQTRQTHGYGATKALAECHALTNFRLKYASL